MRVVIRTTELKFVGFINLQYKKNLVNLTHSRNSSRPNVQAERSQASAFQVAPAGDRERALWWRQTLVCNQWRSSHSRRAHVAGSTRRARPDPLALASVHRAAVRHAAADLRDAR